MRQRCRRARLVQEPGRERRIVGVARGEHLDRHVPIEPEVPCPVHARHAATGELRLDPVPIRQRATDERRTVAHPPAPRGPSHRGLQLAERDVDLGQALERHGRDRAAGLAETDAQRAIRLRTRVPRPRRSRPGRLPLGSASPVRTASTSSSTASIIASAVSIQTGSDGRALPQLADRIHGREARRQMLVGLVQAGRPPRRRVRRRRSRETDSAPSAHLREASRRRRPCWPAAPRSTPSCPGIGRRGKRLGAGSPVRLERARAPRRAFVQLGRGRRRGDEAVRGRDQRLRRIGFAGNDLRRTGARRVQGGASWASRRSIASRVSSAAATMAAFAPSAISGRGLPAPKHDDRARPQPRPRGAACLSWPNGPRGHPAACQRRSSTSTSTARCGRRRPSSWPPTSACRSRSRTRPRRMVGPERCADQAELLTFFDLPIALLQTAPSARARRRRAGRGPCGRRHPVRGGPLGTAPPPRARAVGGRRDRGRGDRASPGPRPLANAPLVTLIVTAMRSHPPAANAELARTAGAIGGPVVGFDLAGPEAAWPAPPHAIAFVAAREAGLALTAHAGEVSGAQRVREVLDFGVTAGGARRDRDRGPGAPRRAPSAGTSRSTCARPRMSRRASCPRWPSTRWPRSTARA